MGFTLRFKQNGDDSEILFLNEDSIKRGVLIKYGYALTDSCGDMTEEQAHALYKRMLEIIEETKDKEYPEEFSLDLARMAVNDLDYDLDIIDLQSEEPIDLDEYGSYLVFNENGDVWSVENEENFDYIRHWNNFNHQFIVLEDDYDPIVVDSDSYSLDEWNGQNYCFNHSFDHARVFVHAKGYIVNTYSLYQHTLSYATLLETDEDLKKYLQSVNRLHHLQALIDFKNETL